MGFCKSFGTHMSHRCFQYAVRSTYNLFEKESKREKKVRKKEEKEKTVRPVVRATPKKQTGVDKNGVAYGGQKWCMFKGERHYITDAKGKMVAFYDGTVHRMSSVEFL